MVFSIFWRGYDDDFFDEFIGSMVGNVPFVGDLYNAFTGWEVDRLDESVINDLVKAVNGVLSPSANTTIFGRMYTLSETVSTMYGVPLKNVRKEFEALLQNVSPKAYYNYLKGFKKPQRRDMYDAMESAINDNDQDFISYLVREMKKDGVKAANIRGSFKSREVNERLLDYVTRQFE